ncbi:MAG: replicative DNA helicase [Planctomycetota bacterium]
MQDGEDDEHEDGEGRSPDHVDAFAGSGFDASEWSSSEEGGVDDGSWDAEDGWNPEPDGPIDEDSDDEEVVEIPPDEALSLGAEPMSDPATNGIGGARAEVAPSTNAGDGFEVPRGSTDPAEAPRVERRTAEPARMTGSGGRITPHDLNAEKCVLGALLLSPDRIVEVSEICKTNDFFDRRNRTLFECMLRLDERSQAIDGVTLASTLRATKKLGDVGGISYLGDIASSVSTSAHVKHHASLVAETSKLRGLIEASNEIISRAMETPPEREEVQTLIDESESAIFSVAARGESRSAAGIESILKDVFHSLEARRGRDQFTGIPSGFAELDDMLGGFNPGEMTVIAARPAMGKTAFVLNLMDHAVTNVPGCLGEAPSVLFFSLEMGRASIVQRMLVARAKVEAHRLRAGRLHDREYSDLVVAAGEFQGARLFIDDTPGLSIMALRSRARRIKAEHGLHMIVIDYLQLLSAKAESRQQEISVISRSLKELARELEVPLITLAQLSRSVESREEKRPQLSDLRESGSIEQDADVVAMLYRPEYYFPTDENKGKAEVLVVKHRNGATGKVELHFQGSMLRFSNLEPSMAEPITGL